MTAVHQLVPDLSPGDAVSGHALELQRLLRDSGYDSRIYCERVHADLAARAEHHRAYERGALIHHLAIGSVLGDLAIEGSMPVAVDHHNLTPPAFFESWEPGLTHGIRWGLDQLARLAGRAGAGIADSSFNARDLDEAGYQRVAVAPILLDTTSFAHDTDVRAIDAASAGKRGRDWLFVGRIVPNKAQLDLVRAFATHQRLVGGHDRLVLVGRTSVPRYESAIRSVVRDLGLDDRVVLTGGVTSAELVARYRTADVLVCLSDHEGFCVPLLEAMHHDVPVVAFGAGAVPETLGGGGLCLPDKSPVVVAEAVERVLTDADLRARLVAGGRARLHELSLDRTRAQMLAALTPWLEDLT